MPCELCAQDDVGAQEDDGADTASKEPPAGRSHCEEPLTPAISCERVKHIANEASIARSLVSVITSLASRCEMHGACDGQRISARRS